MSGGAGFLPSTALVDIMFHILIVQIGSTFMILMSREDPVWTIVC